MRDNCVMYIVAMRLTTLADLMAALNTGVANTSHLKNQLGIWTLQSIQGLSWPAILSQLDAL